MACGPTEGAAERRCLAQAVQAEADGVPLALALLLGALGARMNARPLELPAMRPVSGADSTSIRFFHTPVRMKREKTEPGRTKWWWWGTGCWRGGGRGQNMVLMAEEVGGLVGVKTRAAAAAASLPVTVQE